MQRRHLLAAVLLVAMALLAGCSSAGSLDMRPVNDTVLADQASRRPGPAEPGEPPRWPVAADAIEDGTATVNDTHPPIDGGLPFRDEGRYYTLSREVVATHTETRVAVAIDYNATNTSGDAIAYSELPPVDRALLDAVIPPAEDTRVTDGPDMGVGARYTAAELNASVLAPTQEYHIVTFQGTRYRVTLEDTRPITVHTYRYTATEIASSPAAYATYLREQYAFELADLPPAQADVIAEAIEEGGYYAESTDDTAFAAVVDRFRAHDAIAEDSGTGTWLVRYRGQLYLVDLRYGAFIDG